MNIIRDFLKGFKEGSKLFGDNVAVIINSFFLTIIYFIGIGLTSIFMKISGKNFLDIEMSKEKKSYWEDLNLAKGEMEGYYRQF